MNVRNNTFFYLNDYDNFYFQALTNNTLLNIKKLSQSKDKCAASAKNQNWQAKYG